MARVRLYKYQDESWLRARVADGLTNTQIAELAECGERTVTRWRAKYELGDDRGDNALVRYDVEDTSYRDADWLYDQYWNQEKNTTQIASELGISKSTVTRWMVRHSIPKREFHEWFTGLHHDPEWLHQKYCVEKLTLIEIVELAEVCEAVALKWMRRHGIPIKNSIRETENALGAGRFQQHGLQVTNAP